MSEVKLLPLPAGTWARDMHGEKEVFTSEQAEAYAIRNMEPLIAENERLRAEVAELQSLLVSSRQGAKEARSDRARAVLERNAAHRRAERLAEALRDARVRMLGQVKWVACDCGCEREKPADAVSVAWLREVQQFEIALSKEEGE